MLAGVACFGAALMITPLSAAGNAKTHTARPAIQPVEQPLETASDSDVALEPDPLVGRTKFDWQAQTAASEEDSEADLAKEKRARDKQRMTTHVGDARPVAFEEFYPFPEPAPAAKVSEPKSRKSLYWIGATGVALAAGVAAYFIFSDADEPETVQTYSVL